MTPRNYFSIATLFVLLTDSNAAHAQFNSCALANNTLAVGADRIDFSRIALRADGRPVLAYTNAVHNNASIFFYDCANPACSAGHSVYLDTSSNYFGASGIVIRADGRPAIAASFMGGIRYYDCLDKHCADVTIMTLRQNASAIFSDIPIALQSNGKPVLLYIDGIFSVRPNYLIAYFCADAGCTTGTEQTLAIPPSDSSFISQLTLAVGSDGRIAATHLTSLGPSNLYMYNIARCSDLACTTVINTSISAPIGDSTPNTTAVVIRSDQRPLALDSQSNNRALLDCTNSGCTSAVNRPLPASATGQAVGLRLLTGNLPAFALFNSNVGGFACADALCSSGSAVHASSAATSILDADFTLTSNAQPVIAYIDADSGGLSVAGCSSNVVFVDGFD